MSKRLQLPPGNYCIIPTTFRPGQESRFVTFLKICNQCKINFNMHKNSISTNRFLVRTFVERHWGASGQAAGQSVADGGGVQRGAEGGHHHQLGPRGMTRNVINIPILREDGSASAPPAEEGGGREGKKRGKREQMADFAIGQIEKRYLALIVTDALTYLNIDLTLYHNNLCCDRYPKAGSFLAKLREWYSFPKDRDQEMSLLKVIVDSFRK